jgi:hypothetical protein
MPILFQAKINREMLIGRETEDAIMGPLKQNHFQFTLISNRSFFVNQFTDFLPLKIIFPIQNSYESSMYTEVSVQKLFGSTGTREHLLPRHFVIRDLHIVVPGSISWKLREWIMNFAS